MGYGILKYVEEPEDEETEEAEEPEGAKVPEEAEKSETVEEPEKAEEPKKEVEPENTENAGEENLTEGSNPAPVQNDTEAQAAEQSGDQDTETRREPDELCFRPDRNSRSVYSVSTRAWRESVFRLRRMSGRPRRTPICRSCPD